MSIATIKVKVTQELDKIGDEYMDNREFDIEFILSGNIGNYVRCTIDKHEDCFIETFDLLTALRLIEAYMAVST